MDDQGRSGGACTRRERKRWRRRKGIRLADDAYGAGEPFLLTVCTSGQQALLTTERFGPLAHQSMTGAGEKTGGMLWCGVVMPDHVHLLVSAMPGKSPLDVAACFKRLSTIGVRKLGFAGTLWQRRTHDRGLRSAFDSNLEAAVRYVLENPVRKALVSAWEDWPLSYLHEDLSTFA